MTVEHSGRRWLPFIALLVVIATAAALTVGSGRASLAGAQDAGTPAAEEAGRPAHIHSGSCNDLEEDALGDVVQALNNVTAPTGTTAGQDAASPVETSVTEVPLALDAILGDDHAINVHLSQEEIGTYIACGEIGGTVSDADGSVTIGLREQDGSGFVGVAYLAPGADGASTLVSVFIAEGLAGAGAGAAAEDEGAEEETPAADDEGEATAEATAEAAGGGGDETTVSIVDFDFEPAEITVPVGGTVTWTNDGERPHTATAQDRDVLQSGTIDPGASYSETFDEAGTYDYFCEFHPNMEGTIVVE